MFSLVFYEPINLGQIFIWPNHAEIPLTIPIFGVPTLSPNQIYLTPLAASNFDVTFENRSTHPVWRNLEIETIEAVEVIATPLRMYHGISEGQLDFVLKDYISHAPKTLIIEGRCDNKTVIEIPMLKNEMLTSENSSFHFEIQVIEPKNVESTHLKLSPGTRMTRHSPVQIPLPSRNKFSNNRYMCSSLKNRLFLKTLNFFSKEFIHKT